MDWIVFGTMKGSQQEGDHSDQTQEGATIRVDSLELELNLEYYRGPSEPRTSHATAQTLFRLLEGRCDHGGGPPRRRKREPRAAGTTVPISSTGKKAARRARCHLGNGRSSEFFLFVFLFVFFQTGGLVVVEVPRRPSVDS